MKTVSFDNWLEQQSTGRVGTERGRATNTDNAVTVPSRPVKRGVAPRPTALGMEPDVPTEMPAGYSAVRGGVQGATLGFGDEIRGTLGAIAQMVTLAGSINQGESASATYMRLRDEDRRLNEKARADNPGTYAASELAGGAATMTIPGAGTVKGMTALGAGSGLGHSDADTVAGAAADTAIGGAVGGTLGATVGKVAPVVGDGIKKVTDAINVPNARAVAPDVIKALVGAGIGSAVGGTLGDHGTTGAVLGALAGPRAISGNTVDKLATKAANKIMGQLDGAFLNAEVPGMAKQIAPKVEKISEEAQQMARERARAAADLKKNRDRSKEILDSIDPITGKSTGKPVSVAPRSVGPKRKAEIGTIDHPVTGEQIPFSEFEALVETAKSKSSNIAGDAVRGVGALKDAAGDLGRAAGHGAAPGASSASGSLMSWVKDTFGLNTPAGDQLIPDDKRAEMKQSAEEAAAGIKDGRLSPSVPNVVNEKGKRYLILESGAKIELD